MSKSSNNQPAKRKTKVSKRFKEEGLGSGAFSGNPLGKIPVSKRFKEDNTYSTWDYPGSPWEGCGEDYDPDDYDLEGEY